MLSEDLIENETLGFYEPGFLHLHIHTDEEISDLNQLMTDPEKRKLFSTFFHEYIHFLQEVTTPSGLMNSFLNIDFIKDINWKILKDDKTEFVIPVNLDNQSNVLANDQLRAIYKGDNTNVDYLRYQYYTVEHEAVTERSGRVVLPKKYKVHFYDANRRPRSAYFGHTCIKEFITHTLQQKFYPPTSHPDFPYAIVELIIEKEYPDFGRDPMKAVALCDASLLFLHPAQIFFSTIERMKEQGFVPGTVKDVYDFTFHDVEFTGPMGRFDFASLYQNVVQLNKKQFDNALQSEIFRDNYAWIERILDEGEKLRGQRPHFITELVEDEGRLSPLFFDIVRNLGTPFFTNDKWQGQFISPKGITTIPSQPYQLLVFQQIMGLYKGHTSCRLYEFCKSRPDRDITNRHCLSAPWLRASEEELCPFGQLWKTWGFQGRIPVKA